MHPARIAIVAAAALAAGSLVLPYVTTDLVGDTGGWDATGWPAVGFLTCSALVALVGDRREGLPGPGTLLTTLLAAAACVFAAAKFVDAARAVDTFEKTAAAASIGPGIWLLATAALIGLAGSLWTASRRVV